MMYASRRVFVEQRAIALKRIPDLLRAFDIRLPSKAAPLRWCSLALRCGKWPLVNFLSRLRQSS